MFLSSKKSSYTNSASKYWEMLKLIVILITMSNTISAPSKISAISDNPNTESRSTRKV